LACAQSLRKPYEHAGAYLEDWNSAMAVVRRQGTQTIIDATQPRGNMWLSIFGWLREMWAYRELIRNLVVRDVKVRYKNSVLGIFWTLLNPLLMTLVFTVVFTVMTKDRQDVSNFPVFVLCALLPWNFFSASVIATTSSIVSNGNLINKVYFPREILPLSTVLAELVNFCLALVVLFVMIFGFGIGLTPWLVLLPLVILIQVVFTLGIGFILATLNVFYRDTQHIMSVVMLAWFFVTPIIYPVSILPHNYQLGGLTIDVWRWTHILNPMTSLVATYRVILYDGAPPAYDFLLRTAVTAFVFFLLGVYVFRRYSRRFAEEV
jgi:lipopolysaccharide transport system permease protein